MRRMRRGILFLSLVLTMLAVSANGQDDERSKGIALYRAGNYAEAITVLQKLVDANPANKIAWTYLGGALQNTGKKKQALEAFKKPDGGPISDDKLDSDLKVKSKPRAVYTQDARMNSEVGKVEIMVEFKADGSIGFIVPVRKLRFGLTDNATNAARVIRFDPAVKDGKPVTVIRMMTYGFALY